MPRPAVRLLHAGHGDERGRPRAAPSERRARARSARGSRATSAAAPATTTSSRPVQQRRRRRWREQRGRHDGCRRAKAASARSRQAQGGLRASSPARASTPTTSTLPRQTYAVLPALAARARADPHDRHRGGEGGARRASAIFTGDDLDRRQVGGLPCGWLITQQRRQADEGAAASGAGAGQGALRRRPGRAGGRRDAATQAQGRGRADRGRLRGAAGGGRRRARRRKAGAPQVHDDAPDNNCYDWALGDKAAVDAAFAKARARHQARPRQQPPDPERDRAARGDRALQPRRRRATRSTSPTRTRTSSGC